MKTKVLIVEDQYVEANNLRLVLSNAGYSICSVARSVAEALIIFDKEEPELVLLDIRLQGNESGIDLARILKAKNAPFIFLSANSSQQVFNAAKETAPYGFLVKPFRKKDVLAMVDIACYTHQQRTHLLQKEPRHPGGQHGAVSTGPALSIIGDCPKVKDAMELCRIVASTQTTALITGESGTGKELMAKLIHHLSDRKDGPLVVVNCATLPAHLAESELFGHEKGAFTGAHEKRVGKFEQADGGTIFLDEIGELSLDLQIKFLRVLQEMEIEPISGKSKKIDVRVIAATNKNLPAEIATGRFRIDLYYRINVFPIDLPPLRERKKDIQLLSLHFLHYNAAKYKKAISGITSEAMETLKNHSWPGNIRELQNVIARAVLLCTEEMLYRVIITEDKRTGSKPDEDAIKTIDQNERDHILKVLDKCYWKINGKGGAAELLGINGSTLRSRMQKLGIERR